MNLPSAEQIDRLARLTRDRPHDLDPITNCCWRCGRSVGRLCAMPQPCHVGDNVEALVPHRVRRDAAARQRGRG